MSVQTDQKNINLATVENCNLLCKLILDYLDTKTCTIQKITSQSFRIVYPEGSFINYRDTSYELTYAYFFYPSRHSIDGEKYDLEVNIYHGKFGNRGMVTHTHYHLDSDSETASTMNQHKHFHYHLPGDSQNETHVSDTKHIEKNLVTCLLFNKGQHVGSDVNIFFNQFIHHPEFKKITTHQNEKEIAVHENWTIEQIYPKKRSFFMYDEGIHTIVVFDTIQTISKEIIDRLYKRGIEGVQNYDISNETMSFSTPDRVLYRKNIEVITDAAYKKSKRSQIKDLLSLTRMSTYKPMQRTSKEYFYFAEGIKNTYSGGENTDFYNDEAKAKRLSALWEEYGEDIPIEKTIDKITNPERLLFNSDTATKYNYVEMINNFIVDNSIKRGDTQYLNNNLGPNFFDNRNEEAYLKGRRKLYKLLSYNNKYNRSDQSNKNFFHINTNTDTESIFSEMKAVFVLILKEILFGLDQAQILFPNVSVSKAKIENDLSNDSMAFAKIATFVHNQILLIPNYKYGGEATEINERNVLIENMVGFESYVTIDIQSLFNSATDQNTNYGDYFYSETYGGRINNPFYDRSPLTLTDKLRDIGIENASDFKQFVEDFYDCRFLLGQLLHPPTQNDANFENYRLALMLRIFFEDIDSTWKSQNEMNGSMFQSTSSRYLDTDGDGVTENQTLDVFKTTFLNLIGPTNLENNFEQGTKFVFQERGQKMTRTLSNEKCQNWLSHETHYEGELWKFWEKPPKMGKNEKMDWNSLSPELKQTIKDGMLSFDVTEGKWKTNNQCRNPGNRAAGPWCYTTNPNKRWEYCQKPYYSDVLGKFVLFLVFIFIAVIAFFTIKTLFLHEYPMKFVAKLTGGDFATKGTFTKGQGAGVAPTK